MIRGLAVLMIPVLLGAVGFELNRRGFFALEQVDITVGEGETAAHLKPWIEDVRADLLELKGVSLWTLPLDKISKALAGRTWIKSYQITRRWPGALEVVLSAHPVRALVLGRRGQLIPVLQDGRLLEAVEPSASPDVALLEGREFVADPELRKQAMELLGDLPEKGAFSRESVAAVRWKTKTGFEAKLTERGTRVRLGDSQFGLKAVRLSQVIEYLESRGLKAESLDANLSKKVLVRLREEAPPAPAAPPPTRFE